MMVSSHVSERINSSTIKVTAPGKWFTCWSHLLPGTNWRSHEQSRSSTEGLSHNYTEPHRKGCGQGYRVLQASLQRRARRDLLRTRRQVDHACRVEDRRFPRDA